MAPECFDLSKKVHFGHDIWAIGIITASLVLGNVPIPKYKYIQDYNQYITDKFDIRNNFLIRNLANEELREFLSMTLCKEIEERMTIDQVLNHQFLSMN
jgi:serine/threonine protein kinase